MTKSASIGSVGTPTTILQTKSHKRVFQIGFALVVLSLIGFFVIRAREGAAAGEPQYRVASVQTGSVRRAVSATGTLQPWTTVDIKSKAGGRVNELDVDVGSIVKPNQILAKIDPTDSLLTFNQAKADTDSAKAKESQGGAAYQLQVSQSQSAILEAKSALGVAEANEGAAAARLQTARDQLTAQPAQTAATVAQAQANYDSEVQARAQLTETQTQDRAAAQAAYDEAAANDRNTQAYLTRIKAIYAKGFIAASDVDQAVANAGVSAATLASAKAKLGTLTMQQKAAIAAEDAKVRQALAQLKSAKVQIDVQTRRSAVDEAVAAENQAAAQVRQSRALLAQAEADVANNQIKALDIASAHAASLRADAALTNAKATLDQTVVRAPTEGVVLQKYVEQGTIITSGLSLNSTGTSIVQIGDVTRMFVYVLVDETDIGSVKVGQHVDVSFDAFPGMNFSGSVARIDPQAQVVQNVTSVGVRVEIDNSNPNFKLLKPNLNATCNFIVDEKKSVLFVPSDAVQSDANGSFVQVVISPPPTSGTSTKKGVKIQVKRTTTATLKNVKLEHRPVQVGFKGDDATEILSGLKEGEVVVVQTVTASSTAAATTQARGAVGGFGGGPGGPPRGGR